MSNTKNKHIVKYEKIIKKFLVKENISFANEDMANYCHSIKSYIFDKFEIATIVFNSDCIYNEFDKSYRPYLSSWVYSEKEMGNSESYFRIHRLYKINENIENYLEFVKKFNNFVKEHE